MDPTATLKLLDEAVEAGDREAVVEAATNLRAWLSGNGAKPRFQLPDWRSTLTRYQLMRHFNAIRIVAANLGTGDVQ